MKLNKRVKVRFKDGHVEEIKEFNEIGDKTVRKFRFVTDSGLYLCDLYPVDSENLDDILTRRLSLIRHVYKYEHEVDDGIKVDDIVAIDFISPRISVDDYYLNIAKAVCKRSTCMRRHYGAVIVKNGEIISTGYNGSPRNEDNCCDTGICGREGNTHNDGDYRKCPAVHAEMNALLSAARKDTIGSTLYLYGEDADGVTINASPCPICDALIHNAGVEKIVASHVGCGGHENIVHRCMCLC